ncbi:hypothetical protein EZV62_011371 [Acer yangbiense]|uniref:Phytocyanin domain-containing protein n=1 Tax=Acer yangbiense TaxID=1000413 RepID=A0A5C7I533_9ROSI|nr:hypothetical protein EZV62_011371 [Acer yangbiense]
MAGFGVFDRSMILIVVAASMLVTVSVANRNWYNRRYGNKIIVGGSDHWRYGFNYSVWAFQNNPFYVNDVLVFKYNPPSKTQFHHSVYLLPNMWSYLACDLSRAKLIANTTQGDGEGFEFVLKKRWQPYYFVCGERGGLHCKDGGMKFFVKPMLHRGHY